MGEFNRDLGTGLVVVKNETHWQTLLVTGRFGGVLRCKPIQE